MKRRADRTGAAGGADEVKRGPAASVVDEKDREEKRIRRVEPGQIRPEAGVEGAGPVRTVVRKSPARPGAVAKGPVPAVKTKVPAVKAQAQAPAGKIQSAPVGAQLPASKAKVPAVKAQASVTKTQPQVTMVKTVSNQRQAEMAKAKPPTRKTTPTDPRAKNTTARSQAGPSKSFHKTTDQAGPQTVPGSAAASSVKMGSPAKEKTKTGATAVVSSRLTSPPSASQNKNKKTSKERPLTEEQHKRLEEQKKARKKRRARRILKSVAILFIVLILLAGAAFGVVRFREYSLAKPERELAAFNKLWDGKHYAQAVENYHVVRDGALKKSGFFNDQPSYIAAREKMEKSIYGEIDEIFDNLEQAAMLHKEASLTPDQTALIKVTRALVGARLTDRIKSVSVGLLNGSITADEAHRIFEGYYQTGVLDDQITGHNAEIDSIATWSKPYVEAMSKSDDFERAAALNDLAKKLDGENSFVNEQVRNEINTIKNKIKPPIIKEVDQLVADAHFFEARDVLAPLKSLYPDDNDVVTKEREIELGLPTRIEDYAGRVVHVKIPMPTRLPVTGELSERMTTPADRLSLEEFRKLLDDLYHNNYVLMRETDLLKDGKAPGSFAMPAGKRPIILTLVSDGAGPRAAALGTDQKLELAEDQRTILAFGSSDGHYGKPGPVDSAVTVLNSYCDEHPDFALDGARATLAIGGQTDVLGYLVSPEQTTLTAEQAARLAENTTTFDPAAAEAALKKATAVADRMRAQGWVFACLAGPDSEQEHLSLEAVEKDVEAWKKNAGVALGPVETFVYPDYQILHTGDEAHTYLTEQGFHIFSGIGPDPYLIYNGENAYMDCQKIDPYTLAKRSLDWLVTADDLWTPGRKLELEPAKGTKQTYGEPQKEVADVRDGKPSDDRSGD